MSDYEAIVGMEVHAQLLTKSKMFCGCDAEVFGAAPNTHTCPVCLGMPGVLPVINRLAVEQTIRVGLALNCQIAETAVFSRKNYFYPDLPKAYQISMYDFPLCQHGWIEIDDPDGSVGAVKRIRIRRVHLEEETAKSFHAGDHSLVDFNRAGLPLMEIVTEPDIYTAEEARQYLIKLRTILRYLGVSSGDMEKGAMRCEPNVSIRPAGVETFGTKVEVKNLNSFRSVKLALDYEISRQARVLDAGDEVLQVTMGWDERQGRTVEQRTKETSEDYRYFPEPDLPPLRISPLWVHQIRAALPELPDRRRDRFMADYGLSRSEAATLSDERDVADFFEAAAAAGQRAGVAPKVTSNWLTGELFRLLRAEGVEIGQVRIKPAALAELVTLVERGAITSNSGKMVLGEMFATGRPAAEIVEAKGLAQISNQDALIQVVEEILAANPDQVARYREGKETLLQWFVGQVMRATRGKANPQVVMALLQERL
ncbi:MAG TPA: Asp-tRNA(Asn)/Glu-tRNA(Gln) amidotransferase subunit GatB [Anaerolineae bacterium]|nr:Asp-tRNA(Asn)/Glu-tRNA(Gln) amidotransferase subunit GatB [Anaerolineae bacterium]